MSLSATARIPAAGQPFPLPSPTRVDHTRPATRRHAGRQPGMSMPRAVIPGRCYLVTRRCSERRFFLRPDQATNNAFKYCLALAARNSGVTAIGLGVTSNHYHLVLVDKQGHLPHFLEHFHKLLAKHQNALRGRWEAFWASEQTSVVELVKPEDVMAKLVYAIANPVSSHLVDKVHHWPGVESLTAIDQDLPLVATKPLKFFDQNNKNLPELLELRFARAPGFESLSHEEYTKLLRDEVTKAEKAAADERRERGITIVGRAAVLKQHWNAKPSSHEPRRGMSPRVACKNKWARLEALNRNKAFIEQYREARIAKLGGQDAVFPAGTWWLHRFAGVKRAEPDATAPPG
jgi:putative transposase